jgi:hypothetical protein
MKEHGHGEEKKEKEGLGQSQGDHPRLIGLILIAALGGAWVLGEQQPDQDRCSNRVSGLRPTAIHAILIDRSDPIEPLQALQAKQTIDRYVRNARIGERFDLYTANGDAGNVLSTASSVCNPGRGDQANELYQNPQMIQRQFEEKFLKPLEASLQQLLSSSTADSSPILESIRAAAVPHLARWNRDLSRFA